MAENESIVKTEEPSPPSPEAEVRDILISNLDMRRLIELDACTRCGECEAQCTQKLDIMEQMEYAAGRFDGKRGSAT